MVGRDRRAGDAANLDDLAACRYGQARKGKVDSFRHAWQGRPVPLGELSEQHSMRFNLNGARARCLRSRKALPR